MHIPENPPVPDQAFLFRHVAFLFANSVVIGLLLVWVTYLVVCRTETEEGEVLSVNDKQKLFLGASNLLFMCVGLTGVMLLVNNNLARAFAIGAALSLSRFRVKISKKSTGTHLMFGIIAGIACGLDQVALAWGCSLIYAALQLALFFLFRDNKPAASPV
jgi:hypothetical protein